MKIWWKKIVGSHGGNHHQKESEEEELAGLLLGDRSGHSAEAGSFFFFFSPFDVCFLGRFRERYPDFRSAGWSCLFCLLLSGSGFLLSSRSFNACQMVPKRVSIQHPLGSNWHPLKVLVSVCCMFFFTGLDTCLADGTIRNLHMIMIWSFSSYLMEPIGLCVFFLYFFEWLFHNEVELNIR